MQASLYGVMGDDNVGGRPQGESGGPGSDGPVTQRQQLKVTVVAPARCSWAFGARPSICTSGGLEAFVQSLDDGVAHSKPSGDLSVRSSILKLSQRLSTVKC